MMKKSIFVSIVTVALVGVVGITGVFAQAPDPQEWTPGSGYKNQAVVDEVGLGINHDEMLTVISEVLEIPVEELQARIDAGETLMDIALESGMSFEEIQVLMPMGGTGQQGTGRLGRWAVDGEKSFGQTMNGDQASMYGDPTGTYGDGTCLEDGDFDPQYETQQNGTSRGGRWNR